MNNGFGKSMRFKHTLAVIALACLALAAACAVNPVTGQQELSFMSEGQEVALGAQNYPLYTQKMGGKPADDKGLQDYVNNLGRKLAATSHRPNLPWEFNVVNHSSVNAMALPGGKIMVTRGLLNKLNSEDELAFVLGHEIGHVTARHAASQYTNGVLISVAVMGVGAALQGSDYAPLGTAVAGAAGSLLMLSYSRDQERQADELGYSYMVQNNYNPKAMLEVFKIFRSLEKEEPGVIGAMLRSHPLTSERIDYTKNMVDRTKPGLLQRPFQVAGYNNAVGKLKSRQKAYAAMDHGDAFMGQSRFAEAGDSYQAAIRMLPQEGLFHTRLAMVRVRQKQLGPAKTEAELGAQLSPDLFYTNHMAGLINLMQKDVKSGHKYLAKADRIVGNHAVNKYLLGLTYEAMGQRRQAAYIYQSVARMAPRTQAGQSALKRLNYLNRGY